MRPFKPLAAAAGGLLLVVLLREQVPYLNGPRFFAWPYHALPYRGIYSCVILAAVPFFLAQLLYAKQPRVVWLCLPLMMLSCFGMKLASVAFRDDITQTPTPNLKLISIIVENPDATSYFTDAAILGTRPLREWIALYPIVLPQLHLHTYSKPPGAVMYWDFWINQLGLEDIDRTALVGGLGVGALATLSIPATYLFLCSMLRHRPAAFCGASFLSLCPGFILFFPMMDPIYILLTTPLIGCWFAALRQDRMRWSLLCGLVLGLCGIITFNILVIGFFMAALPLLLRESASRKLLLTAKHGTIVIGAAVITLVLLRAVLNYDVIDTFRSAWENQHRALLMHGATRKYPQTVPFDLNDFALGSGYISVMLCCFYFARRAGGTRRKLAWFGLAQFVVVAATGLLQLETARVWNFMLPLLMIPIGLELARWPWQWRLAPLATMVLINAAIAQNLKWIY